MIKKFIIGDFNDKSLTYLDNLILSGSFLGDLINKLKENRMFESSFNNSWRHGKKKQYFRKSRFNTFINSNQIKAKTIDKIVYSMIKNIILSVLNN